MCFVQVQTGWYENKKETPSWESQMPATLIELWPVMKLGYPDEGFEEPDLSRLENL
jgi:hypothetical protein